MSGRVLFVGAGPGDPELITVKGLNAIRAADLVLYAGSLVPRELTREARPEATVVDSAPLTLEETHALLSQAVASGGLAVRLHTGDPSLFGAIREQMRLLDADGIPYAVVPGVTAACAAAAAAAVSFTAPEITQTLILTRREGRTPMPEREKLPQLARAGAAMAVYLSAGDAAGLADDLAAGGYPPETPVVIGAAVGWPGEKILRTTLAHLPATVAAAGITRQAVFLILPGEAGEATRSKLYEPGFAHGWRES